MRMTKKKISYLTKNDEGSINMIFFMLVTSDVVMKQKKLYIFYNIFIKKRADGMFLS